MNDSLIAQLIAQLPDSVVTQALAIKQQGGAGGGLGGQAGGDPLSGLAADPENAPKNWNDLQIQTLGDQRPPLTDKSFLVPKQNDALGQIGLGAPHDDGSGAYAAPGGF